MLFGKRPSQGFERMYDRFKKDVSLSEYTSIKLGGSARYFYECRTYEELLEVVRFAKAESLKWMLLGGGSNIIFSDRGFKGLVIHMAIPGIEFEESSLGVVCRVGAGVVWDEFVVRCIEQGLGGLECLSGIPGLVGSVPVQNVGAYGQEVGDRILNILAFDTIHEQLFKFSPNACEFAYRNSRFKSREQGRYIITEVTFHLSDHCDTESTYPELQRALEADPDFSSDLPGTDKLTKIRSTVLNLRRGKSMVLDDADPNTRSCGSFFLNPVLFKSDFAKLKDAHRERGGEGDIPFYNVEELIKIPAAWLVENSGYPKGTKRGGVGISDNHSLALVNRDGTTKELLAFAREIQEKVQIEFGVSLEREPVYFG